MAESKKINKTNTNSVKKSKLDISKLDIEQQLDLALKAPAFIHPAAHADGNFKLGKGSSLWAQVTLRADFGKIEVGKYANVQENVSMHTELDGHLSIGEYALIGHGAVLHGCHIGAGALIGINCTVLDEAEVGAGSLVTAGVTIRGRKKIPPRSLVTGQGDSYKIFANKAKTEVVIEASLLYCLNALFWTNGIKTLALNSAQKDFIKQKAIAIKSTMPFD